MKDILMPLFMLDYNGPSLRLARYAYHYWELSIQYDHVEDDDHTNKDATITTSSATSDSSSSSSSASLGVLPPHSYSDLQSIDDIDVTRVPITCNSGLGSHGWAHYKLALYLYYGQRFYIMTYLANFTTLYH